MFEIKDETGTTVMVCSTRKKAQAKARRMMEKRRWGVRMPAGASLNVMVGGLVTRSYT